MSKLIYVAEDDSLTRGYIKSIIEKEGYCVEAFETGDQLFIAFQRQPCDLVILDAIMPGNNGFVVCEMLRQISNVPIIMLSALNTDEDYASGISRGCNVYLAKPFSEIRFIVNVNSLLSNYVAKAQAPAAPTVQSSDTITFLDLRIYPSQLIAYCNKNELALTSSEFNLLIYMIENKERALPREELRNQLWGADSGVGIRVTDDVIKRLRKKLSCANSKVSIDTIWGFGFRLNKN